MKRVLLLGTLLILLSTLVAEQSVAQPKWAFGGRMGVGILSGSAAFLIGPTGEVMFNKNMAVGSELDILISGGASVGWINYFRYYFNVPGSPIRPFAHAGLGPIFGGGYTAFALVFGGGSLFPITNKLYIPAEIQFGPAFGGGGSAFFIEISSGIRYEL